MVDQLNKSQNLKEHLKNPSFLQSDFKILQTRSFLSIVKVMHVAMHNINFIILYNLAISKV